MTELSTNYFWHNVVAAASEHMVKVETPRGWGTGFLVGHGKEGVIGIATAAHVIEEAHKWEEPIRITKASGETELVHASARALHLDRENDTAAIIFKSGNLKFPDALTLMDQGKNVVPGVEVGWLGYPNVAQDKLCFFSGRISAWIDRTGTYLVDGVAINGVSGGPALLPFENSIYIAGVVSQYLPNRANSTPGLCVIRDVRQFQILVSRTNSVEEAKVQETPVTQPPDPPLELPGNTDQKPVSK